MRPHDIGASGEFGPIDPHDDGVPFHHEWEARVFALNSTLLRRGVYTLDEFRCTIEQMRPDDYHGSSYYERWLHAIETLLTEKGIAVDGV